MGFYRWRIVLLSLGVVLGYGSAVHHFMHPHDHCHGYQDRDQRYERWGFGRGQEPGPNSDHGAPAKKVP